MAARVHGAFPADCHKTQAVPGGHQGRPYGGDGSAVEQTASVANTPAARGRFAARTRDARPYGTFRGGTPIHDQTYRPSLPGGIKNKLGKFRRTYRVCVMTSSMDIASPIFLIIGALVTLAPNFITIDTDSLLYANSSLWYANILAIFI